MRMLPRILSTALAGGAISALVTVVRMGHGRPHEGDRCTVNRGVCADDRTALTCEDGRLVAAPCRGPQGCQERSGSVRCDVSGNRDGDRCGFGTALGDTRPRGAE